MAPVAKGSSAPGVLPLQVLGQEEHGENGDTETAL